MAYNPRKAAQTIAYFILKNGGDLNVLKAIKLVYLADRERIKTYGSPIQDEERVSMPHGPVNSSTYRHIQGEVDLASSGWADFLSDKANHCIGLANKAIVSDDLGELSEADIEVLDKVWADFGAMNQWELRDWTHVHANVPEWEDPKGSSQPIPLLRIMRAVDLPNAEEHAAEVEAFSRMDDMWQELGARAQARRGS